MTQLAEPSAGVRGIVKDLMYPDTVSTEVDIHQEGVTVVKSLCYFCHANCGVLAYVKDGDVIKIEGDPNYSTQGGLCCRGTSALLHVNHPARINHALKRVGKKGENKWEKIPYDQAIQEVADRLNQIKEESGAEAVASAGGTTRTDDWARRRFLNQFGTPNGFHNALLCWIPTFMAETCVAGWSPFETDLGGAKSLILWGMNPGASTLGGMHGYTDLQMNGLKIIVVDPRYSETACKADLWLPLRPGSDAALALSMLHTIIYEGMCDFNFIGEYCDGFGELTDHIVDYTPEWASEITWLTPDQIREAARMYAMNKPGCIQWGCTWDQIGRASTTGSHAIALLRAVCGNLDVPGGDGMPGPAMNFMTDEELELNELLPEEQKSKQIGSNRYKLTSWPGYSIISETAKRQWGKTLPTEWFCEAHGPSVFKAILTGDPYQIRALICNATNPINSYGDAKMTLAALKACEFLVVVDYWMTPTALFADYVFPAAGALERPTIVTHYGATDSLMGGARAIQPKYDRHTDMTFWRKLGLACGQDPANWPWETEEEAYWAVMEGIGLPVTNYNEFVEQVRMYYPPLHQSKFIDHGGFWTPSGKVELNSTILRELGYPGMPTYIGCIENEIDTPELCKDYPVVLTTGGGFMPYHHSEHFQMQHFRFIYPDPYFSINPDLAKKLKIKYGDWCWIETRRGRIKMRANVEPEVDPRVVFVPRGWWFPERGCEDLNNPFGCLESNTNVLTSVDGEHCDPMGGSWANRGLMCKVYKCTELDHVYREEDTKFSIPGSVAEPGIHIMPSEEPLAREPIAFVPPEPDFAIPEGSGLIYDWKRGAAYDPKTGFTYDPESGWLVENTPSGTVYHDLWTGWAFDAEKNLLLDQATGKYYDMQTREEVPFVAGIRCYPGQPNPPYEIPDTLVWNQEKGYATLASDPTGSKIYNPDSGWLVGIDSGVFYDVNWGCAYDPTLDLLLDENTGKYYTKTYEEVPYVAGVRCYPGQQEPPYELRPGVVWNSTLGYATPEGDETGSKVYDPNSGWLVDVATGVYYDCNTGYAYDPTLDLLTDEATGKHYDRTTYEEVCIVAGMRCYPGQQEPPYELRPGVVWNSTLGYATPEGDETGSKVYDPNSGWLVDVATGVYYDCNTGYAYDPTLDLLTDEATGKHYDRTTYEEVPIVAGIRCYPGLQMPPYELSTGVMWNRDLGYATRVGDSTASKIYDPDSGWLIDINTGVYYDCNTGYAYDPNLNLLLDEATGTYYTLDYQVVDPNAPAETPAGTEPATESAVATASADTAAATSTAQVQTQSMNGTAQAAQVESWSTTDATTGLVLDSTLLATQTGSVQFAPIMTSDITAGTVPSSLTAVAPASAPVQFMDGTGQSMDGMAAQSMNGTAQAAQVESWSTVDATTGLVLDSTLLATQSGAVQFQPIMTADITAGTVPSSLTAVAPVSAQTQVLDGTGLALDGTGQALDGTGQAAQVESWSTTDETTGLVLDSTLMSTQSGAVQFEPIMTADITAGTVPSSLTAVAPVSAQTQVLDGTGQAVNGTGQAVNGTGQVLDGTAQAVDGTGQATQTESWSTVDETTGLVLDSTLMSVQTGSTDFEPISTSTLASANEPKE